MSTACKVYIGKACTMARWNCDTVFFNVHARVQNDKSVSADGGDFIKTAPRAEISTKWKGRSLK